MRIMWRETNLFGNQPQTNAINLLEAISLLLFKPGFTILDLEEGEEVRYFAIDEHAVWRSGISTPEATNHYET